ncbi:MAG: hypothetical protein JKY01_10550 [Pseudomonadales bacterium]|nr:hypothetical protein [Pseudomonadales bacterium]
MIYAEILQPITSIIGCKGRRFFIKLLLYIYIISLVLNPYTIYGRPGIAISILLVLYALKTGAYKVDLKENNIIFCLLFVIGLFGALISYVSGIGQFSHPFVVISLMIVWLSAQALHKLCIRYGFEFDEFVLIILHVILLNYVFILMEVNFPTARSASEKFLAPAGNIDWTEGFRYRGISASGGAGLSLLLPVATTITFYLYNQKKIGLLSAGLSFSVSLLATLVIGRTGLVLLPIVFAAYLILIIRTSLKRPQILVSSSFLTLLIISMTFLGYDYLVSYLEATFGAGFIEYSFGFLLQGSDGIKSEGTVGVIAQFLTVLPTELPEILTGYGFYGGSDFSPWTDSGYSRMFLSVGWPLGLLFYFCVFRLFFKNYRMKSFLISTMGVVLLAAETKEPMLLSGNSARVFVLIVVFLSMQRVTERSKSAVISSNRHKN